jgi:hypothetical protein
VLAGVQGLEVSGASYTVISAVKVLETIGEVGFVGEKKGFQALFVCCW